MESVLERECGLRPPQVYVPASESRALVISRNVLLLCDDEYLTEILGADEQREIPGYKL